MLKLFTNLKSSPSKNKNQQKNTKKHSFLTAKLFSSLYFLGCRYINLWIHTPVAGPRGFEPRTSGSAGQRLNPDCPSANSDTPRRTDSRPRAQHNNLSRRVKEFSMKAFLHQARNPFLWKDTTIPQPQGALSIDGQEGTLLQTLDRRRS